MVSSEPDSAELQEAISKTTFRQQVNNLDAATTYSVFLKAYSALGGSQQSRTIVATTKGGGKSIETAPSWKGLHPVHLKRLHAVHLNTFFFFKVSPVFSKYLHCSVLSVSIVPSSPSFFTKVLNQTAMQVYWELPSRPGALEGFRLEYRGVSNPQVHGQETFPAHINTHTISDLGQCFFDISSS